MDSFKLIHNNGRVFAFVVVENITYEKDITEYLQKANAIDDWLDYQMGLIVQNKEEFL